MAAKDKEKQTEEKNKKIGDMIRKLGNGFRLALFPEEITCDVCGKELIAKTRYNVCGECTEKLTFVGEHICLVCGAPIANEADYCIRCQRRESVFRYNRSPLAYEGAATDLILSLKFGRKKYIAETLGAMMADTYIARGMSADIIVPVPMSEKEVKARGFNQAELIAENIGRRLNMPVLPALVKNRDTKPQKELGGKERAENLKDVFAVIYKQVSGLRILLVDDVFTTGTTANECAKTLLHSRAKEVFVLTAAVTKEKLPTE